MDTHFHAAVICSEEIARQLPKDLRERFAGFIETSADTPLSFAKARLSAYRMEANFRPDVVYTIFGPSYWVPRAPQATGFAYGSLLFGRVSKPDYNLGSDGFVDYSSWKDVARRWFLQRADAYLVESDEVRRRLARYLGVSLDRITVVGNTIGRAFEGYSFPEAHSSNRSILVPAPYYEHKNLEIVPFIAKLLVDVHGLRDFVFTLTIPECTAGWNHIKASADSLGVSAHIRTAGAVSYSDMPALYGEASCVFLPTLMECFTAVYPESFHAGRPLITSKRDFAEDLCGGAAVYCDPLDPADCAKHIAATFHDSAGAKELVARGRHRLSAHFVTAPERYSRIIATLQRIARKF
ncbi:MAG: glycosyltransferase [Betaproteobacteria bacterium]|nr:glycosyltransferase [Betaproteobacteria bacterium]